MKITIKQYLIVMFKILLLVDMHIKKKEQAGKKT